MRALAARLARLEAHTGDSWFTFTTTAGRTVRASALDVLAVYLGESPPAVLADVADTRETSALARGAVQAAIEARTAGVRP